MIVYSVESLNQALDSLRANHFSPTVAIAFSSPDFPFEASLAIFNQYSIEVVGCTTSGEVCDDRMIEGSLSLLLMDIAPQYFRTARFVHEDVEAYTSGAQLCEIALAEFAEPGIILLISGVGIAGDGPIDGIRNHIRHEIPIYGGLAGDNLQHKATHTFTHQGVSDFGVAALILDTTKIRMRGLAVSGWEPLGRVHTVTRSERNIIYEIDEKPALDLFLNYFGNIGDGHAGTGASNSIAGQYPIRLQQPEGASALRSLLIYDTENRALIAAGNVPTHTKFRFCPTPDFSVIEETVRQFQQFGEASGTPEAVVMISCKGRHTSFGPLLSDEVRGIYQVWRAPMVGFFSNGEIGNDLPDGKCAFHNVTCSVVTLSEV